MQSCVLFIHVHGHFVRVLQWVGSHNIARLIDSLVLGWGAVQLLESKQLPVLLKSLCHCACFWMLCNYQSIVSLHSTSQTVLQKGNFLKTEKLRLLINLNEGYHGSSTFLVTHKYRVKTWFAESCAINLSEIITVNY